MSDDFLSLPERVAKLETRQNHYDKRQDEVIEKLDELLGLRNKGIGAFWVVSALTGTGMIGIILSVVEWLKGSGHA